MNARLKFIFLRLLTVGALASATLFGQPATAGRSLADRQPLIVGTSGDGYPYSFYDDQGRPTGFAAELLDAVGRTMNLRFTRVSHPGITSYANFRQGEFDLLQLISQTPEREAYAEFSVPILTLQGAVFVRRGGPIHTVDDLKGAEFAIVGVGSMGERFLRDHGLHARVRQIASTTEALHLIEKGEVAGTFVTQLTALAIIKKSGLHDVVMLGPPLDGYDVRHCFAVHRGDAQLLARLNEGLAILHANGEFDRIYDKWFQPLTGTLFTRQQVTTYVVAALALAFLAALWGVARQRALLRRIAQLNAGLESGIATRTAELAARVTEVERLNAEQETLMRDLWASQLATDRAAVSLREANAQLLAANQELEAFSYTASHDLRAPLRNITGFIELLERRTAGRLDAESTRFIAVMTEETRRMGLLIDHLLAFSRIGRAEIKWESVPLAELVAEVGQRLQAEATDRTIEWRIGALPVVKGDRALLRQVITNLMGNAVKFTRYRHPAIVEVGATPDGEGPAVKIFVRDNGAGFNPKYADKLFGVFQRLHNARDFEGTGIGLAIVSRIVTRHGGRVWADGQVEQGATFYFTLTPANA